MFFTYWRRRLESGVLSFALLAVMAGCQGATVENTPETSRPAATNTPQPKQTGNALLFRRTAEPRENAFSLLAPDGWKVEGGIFRVDPTAAGGPANAIAAKVDFTVHDAAGQAAIRWLPDVLFFDPRRSPAGQMGLFPPGSNYQGMTVRYLMPAIDFLEQVAFPYARPGVSGVQFTERKALPEVARKYQARVAAFPLPMTFQYDAGLVEATYMENGVAFRERIFTVIEDWGQTGAGMWGNKEAVSVRAPADRFEETLKLLDVIQNSVKINQQWMAGEIQGQVKRGQIVLRTQQEVQRIGREITAHRQQTNAEIHNDMFLTLTEQEEYVNPYTGEVEVDSNQWPHRWVNESGDVIFADTEEYDPNVDVRLTRSDFKRTRVRPR